MAAVPSTRQPHVVLEACSLHLCTHSRSAVADWVSRWAPSGSPPLIQSPTFLRADTSICHASRAGAGAMLWHWMCGGILSPTAIYGPQLPSYHGMRYISAVIPCGSRARTTHRLPGATADQRGRRHRVFRNGRAPARSHHACPPSSVKEHAGSRSPPCLASSRSPAHLDFIVSRLSARKPRRTSARPPCIYR